MDKYTLPYEDKSFTTVGSDDLKVSSSNQMRFINDLIALYEMSFNLNIGKQELVAIANGVGKDTSIVWSQTDPYLSEQFGPQKSIDVEQEL